MKGFHNVVKGGLGVTWQPPVAEVTTVPAVSLGATTAGNPSTIVLGSNQAGMERGCPDNVPNSGGECLRIEAKKINGRPSNRCSAM